MLHLVSYDIVDTRRRTKLAKKLLNFGQRVQFSVFECELNPEQFEAMKKQVLPFVDLETDSLRLYRLCETCLQNLESYGVKKGWEEDDGVTVI